MKLARIQSKIKVSRSTLIYTAMALPGLIWLVIFRYVPMAGLYLAFTDYKVKDGFLGSEFVGLSNFDILFATDQAWRAARNTIFLNMLFIVFGTAASIITAALLYQLYKKAITKYFQTALLLPHFISWVIVSYFVFALLKDGNGMMDKLAASVGGANGNYYSSPDFWPLILLLCYLWKHLGWSALIYLAAMLGISPELYEAAEMDGASKVRQFFNLTLPLISPVIIITLLLAVGKIFNADFGLFFQVPRGSSMLFETTDVLDTYIYRALMNSMNVSFAAAATFYQSVVGFVLVVAANYLVRRVDRSQALF